MNVRLRPAARADLLSLHRWIAADRPAAADAMVRRLAEAFDRLADQPGLGRARLPKHPAIRTFPVNPYLIFYETDDRGGVVIVRILHAARDWPRLFD